MINFWVGYTPGREQVNRKCRFSLERFGVKTHSVPHYYVKNTNNPFSRTRYLIPLIDYNEDNKWVAFVDDDFIFFKNPLSLVRDLDENKMVYCCKHENYVSKGDVKMGGRYKNVNYPRKNWSSFMIFNKEKYSLTCKEIFYAPMSYLHQMEWAEPEEKYIGSIPLEWNWLVNEPNYPDNEDIGAAHFTLGGPWYKTNVDNEYLKSIYDKHWIEMEEYDINKDWS